MPKIKFMTVKDYNFSENEMKDYLVNEQGYTDEEVDEMPIENIVDLYEMYHED